MNFCIQHVVFKGALLHAMEARGGKGRIAPAHT
jgi:hypothetical protein